MLAFMNKEMRCLLPQQMHMYLRKVNSQPKTDNYYTAV